MCVSTQSASSNPPRPQPGSLLESLRHKLFADVTPSQIDLLAAVLLLAALVLKEALGVAAHSEGLLFGAFFFVARSYFMRAEQPRSVAAKGDARAARSGAKAGAASPRQSAGRQPKPCTHTAGRPATPPPPPAARPPPAGAPERDPDLVAEGTTARAEGKKDNKDAAATHLGRPEALVTHKADKAPDALPPAPAPRALPARAKPVHTRCRGLRGEALRLYAEALESGAAADLGFFRVVAASLDEAAMRESAADLLRAMREQSLVPDLPIQTQLMSPFKGHLPDDLMEVFWALREEGCALCWTVHRAMMIAYERKAPERTLALHEDMASCGTRLDRSACNAVLCALAQAARAGDALQLFQEMCSEDKTSPSSMMTPNGKTYGSVIRACTAGGKDQVAVALFDCMVTKGVAPNRFAYHDAILSCMRLKQMSRALSLYAKMKKDRVPPCDNTLRLLIRTCAMRGWHGEAASISEDFRKAKSAETGARVDADDTTDFRESSADGESE